MTGHHGQALAPGGAAVKAGLGLQQGREGRSRGWPRGRTARPRGEAARLGFRAGEAQGELMDAVLGAPGGRMAPPTRHAPSSLAADLRPRGSTDATHFLPSWACRCTSWSPSTAW